MIIVHVVVVKIMMIMIVVVSPTMAWLFFSQVSLQNARVADCV